jgi:membrane protease YdiL (CAAX protease family)
MITNRMLWNSQPLSSIVPLSLWAIPMFLLQALVNGISEETLDRGYLMPQLHAFLHRPWLVMLVMIVVFDFPTARYKPSPFRRTALSSPAAGD